MHDDVQNLIGERDANDKADQQHQVEHEPDRGVLSPEGLLGGNQLRLAQNTGSQPDPRLHSSLNPIDRLSRSNFQDAEHHLIE